MVDRGPAVAPVSLGPGLSWTGTTVLHDSVERITPAWSGGSVLTEGDEDLKGKKAGELSPASFHNHSIDL